MNCNKIALVFMLLASLFSYGCGQNNEVSDKKEIDEKSVAFVEVAKNHYSSKTEMPNYCPDEHRKFLETLDIKVPSDETISFKKSGVNKEVLNSYNFGHPDFRSVTVVLFESGDKLGEIKDVIAEHSVSYCGENFYIVKNEKTLGKIKECYGNHMEEHMKKDKADRETRKISDTQVTSQPNSNDNQFMADFNTVMSNQYNGLYAGSQLSIGSVTAGSVRIFVTPVWYSLNEGQKNAFVMQTAKWYFGMMGARGMSYNMDQIDLFFRDSNTGKQVAKWGSIRGAVINN